MSIFECGKSSLNMAASNVFFNASEISTERLQTIQKVRNAVRGITNLQDVQNLTASIISLQHQDSE